MNYDLQSLKMCMHDRQHPLCSCMHVQVPLGILLKNETKHEDMIDIMSSLQRYVPTVHSTAEQEIPLTGEKVQVSYILTKWVYTHAYIQCTFNLLTISLTG